MKHSRFAAARACRGIFLVFAAWGLVVFAVLITTARGQQQQHDGHSTTEQRTIRQHASPAAPNQSPPPRASGQQLHEGHEQPERQEAQPSQGTTTPTTQQQQHAGHEMETGPGAAPRQQQTTDEFSSGPVMRLEELEQMALKNSPTVAQAEASIRAALGRRRQAGLFPNPVVGYMGEEFAVRAFSESSEHMFFVEQTIPLGGKLKKRSNVFARQADQAEITAATQRQRVLNTVRALYFDALGAQALVELRSELSRLANEAVGITGELYNVGQSDRPDQLEIEIEAQRAEIDLLRARNDREGVWRLLAASIGAPNLKPTRLEGNLEAGIQALDQEQAIASLLKESPDLRQARAAVETARARLTLPAPSERLICSCVEASATTTSGWRMQGNRKVGPEGFIEAGVTLPIFNRNQGGIAAATAEVDIAERDVERLELQPGRASPRPFATTATRSKWRSGIAPKLFHALNPHTTCI
ncbi:MAG: TolC family protein [Pyrinomonadaceae bacterium]